MRVGTLRIVWYKMLRELKNCTILTVNSYLSYEQRSSVLEAKVVSRPKFCFLPRLWPQSSHPAVLSQ